ncbi:MAG: hypothetical protein CMB56_003125 [Methanobacteriota archaeon]|nr:MAG: hypothetical protein CMB56_003125 [Euryarchaeota archaeon]
MLLHELNQNSHRAITNPPIMGKENSTKPFRGKVSRISPKIPSSKINKQESSINQALTKWSRRQDYHSYYKMMIDWELEDEIKNIEDRLKTWSNKKLEDAGLAIFRLKGRTSGWLFGERILTFKSEKDDELPWHRFGQGDIVTISRKRPWTEKFTEGTVLDRTRKRIRVVVTETPEDLRRGNWRLDRAANRIAHDRMNDALDSFALNEFSPTPLDEILMGSLHDINTSSKTPPEIPKKKRISNNVNISDLRLNNSQFEAVMGALTQRLTLIQGPPGTGKTYTAIEILSVMVKHKVGPILATADSNVAVDNLLQGLLQKGINAVRIGQPVKVREKLRESTLTAKMSHHSLNEDIDAIFSENNQIKKNISKLRGKEKGLAHRDMNKNWKEIRMMEKRIIEDIIDDSEVIVATCIGVAHKSIADRKFPVVLIDEATQATETATLVPIVRGARQLILIGDHQQLPPTIISRRAEEGGFSRSLFERLIDAGIEPLILKTQYRMHPSISEFPSLKFYKGLLEDGVSSHDRMAPSGFIWPNWDLPVAFIPVEGIEGTDTENASRFNSEEATKVTDIVCKLIESKEIMPDQIGVITPYNGQVRLISDYFENLGGVGKNEPFSGLEIRSVDGYQGREKDVIIFSTVRSNEMGEVGFLSDRRRLNVALTRAKRGLIIIGNPATLKRDDVWSSWLKWIEEKELMAWHYR